MRTIRVVWKCISPPSPNHHTQHNQINNEYWAVLHRGRSFWSVWRWSGSGAPHQHGAPAHQERRYRGRLVQCRAWVLGTGGQALVAVEVRHVAVRAVGMRHRVGGRRTARTHQTARMRRPGRRSHRRRRQIVAVHLKIIVTIVIFIKFEILIINYIFKPDI